MKKAILSLMVACAVHLAMAAVGVTNVTATLRSAEGLVEISYEVTADSQDENVWLMFEGWDRDRGLAVFPKTLSGDGATGPVKPGIHTTTWHVATDRPAFHSSAFALKVTAVSGLAPYRVLDLSGGASATNFPVRDAAQGPDFTCDSQYTTNLWMRLVLPGTFMMGSPTNELGRDNKSGKEPLHQVTLTQPYYIGVIQTTRKHWALVTGAPVVSASTGRTSETEETLRLPEDDVSYDMIRGVTLGAGWPANHDVDADSFLGMLRAKTGDRIYDLPTEAQWENACRAGTTTALNSGKDLTATNLCPNMAEVGRYVGNLHDGNSVRINGGDSNCAVGGRYLPNNWGVYDMHGNAYEWCADGSSYLNDTAKIDPLGPSKSQTRIIKSGNFASGALTQRSARREGPYPSRRWNTSLSFRLAEHLTNPEGFAFGSAESADFRLELRDVFALDAVLDEGMVVEAGRLAANTVWSNDVIHVVRDWVTVPEGVTLTILPGTQVKFYDDAGIWVMGGGTVLANGTEQQTIRFLPVAEGAQWSVMSVNKGQYEANEYVEMVGTLVGLSSTMRVSSGSRMATVPCSFTSSVIGSPILIAWRTVDGTAKAGTDYVEKSGCLTNEWPYTTLYIMDIPIIVPDSMREDREFEVEFHATGLGINAVWRDKVVIYDTDLVSRQEVAMGEAGVSAGCAIDMRGIGETIAGAQARQITYDTAWDGSTGGVKVTVTAPDGTVRTLVDESGAVSGEVSWTPDAGAGCYMLAHATADGTLTARISVPEADCVRMGTRRVTGAEEWSADKVYLIDGELTVADGGRLTIPAGTVVKFMSGARLFTMGNGVCEAAGVTFTHANDDAVGGDTLGDGDATVPEAGQYDIAGKVKDDAATVYRYRGTVFVQGTIATDTIWHGGQTYVVQGANIHVTNATLTIMPGAIVKMYKDRYIYVRHGGLLDARGTRAQPIVFTSSCDDAHGGDTNGDGDKTIPQSGDWYGLAILENGNIRLGNCKILYGSRGGMRGSVYVRTGKAVLNDTEIAHSAYDAIGVERGGDAFITNCVIRDALAAFRHYNTNEIVNCVVYDCGRITQAGNHKFRNCVFSEITDVWQSGQQPNNFRNCCFWNKGGTKLTGDVAWQTDQTQIVTQDASVYLNRNGNVWGDPLFVDPANGDFRIQEGSACVDAADGTVVPETDFYGQPRVTLLGEPSGIPTPEGCVPDIGVSELMPRNMSADVDFEARRVTAAGPVAPGDEITVKWTVGNLGGREVDGSWRDTVSLVSANGRVVTLGEKVTTGRVPAGGSIVCSGSFTVPTLAEGTWYPKVQVNTYRDVFEGTLTANNAVQGTDPVEVSVAATDMSAAVVGRIVAGVPTVLKLPFTEDASNRLVRMTLPEGVTASWGFGFMPTTGRTGGSPVQSGGGISDGHDVLFLAPDGEQTVYVVLESGNTADYSLTFEDNPLVISSISPTSIPKSGTTSIIVTGAGFTPSNTVSFTSAAGAVAPESVRYVNANTLVATVDCAKFTSGITYATETSVGVLASTLPSALSVTDEEGKGEFWAKLYVPDTVRKGRVCSCYVEYGNSGNVDVDAAIIEVVTVGESTLRISGETQATNVLVFVAASDQLFAGALPPGYGNRIYFELISGGDSLIKLSTSETNIEFSSLWPSEDDFLKDIAKAASVIANRGYDATNFQQVYDLAAAKRRNEFSSAIVGKVVFANGLLAPGVTVRAVLRADTNVIVSAVSRETGFFNIEPTVSGIYDIQADGGILHFPYVANVLDDEDVSLSEVILENRPSVSFVVKNALETTSCFVEKVGDETVSLPYESTKNVFMFSNLETNELYRVTVSSGDRLKTMNFLMADFDSSYEIVLEDVVTVKGQVHDLALAHDTATAFQIELKGSGIDRCVSVDDDGKFQFDGVPCGSYILRVRGSRYSYVVGDGIDVSVGMEDIDLHLEPETSMLSGIVQGGNLTTEVFLSDGIGVANTVQCDGTGAFVFPRVGDGAYSLSVISAGDVVFTTNLVIDAECRSVELPHIATASASTSFMSMDAPRNTVSRVKLMGILDFLESSEWKESNKLFNEAQAFINSHIVRMPDAKYRCSENMNLYNANARKQEQFIKEWQAFGNLSTKTSRMEWIAYSSKIVSDIAIVAGDVYCILHGSRWKMNRAQLYKFQLGEMAASTSVDVMKSINQIKSDINTFESSATTLSRATKSLKLAEILANIKVLSHRIYYHKNLLQKHMSGLLFVNDILAPISTLLSLISDVMSCGETLANLIGAYGKYDSAIAEMKSAMPKFRSSFNAYKSYANAHFGKYHVCNHDKPEYKNPDDSKKPNVGASKDPNEMAGPMGKGDPNTQRFVEPGQWLTYTVYYENDASATAAAQEVFVTNSLSQYLDWSTFEMGEVAFGDQIDLGLVEKQNGTNEVTMTGTNLIVRSVVDLDKEKGEVRWYMRVVDPDSGDTWPTDVTGGFLPPNDKETHCGEGHLTYRIKVRDDAPRGVRIDNSATIVFDTEDPIETDPAWWNIIATHQDVSMTVDGVATNLDLIVGMPYGDLPTPNAWAGHTFAGWYTGPNGTGRRVTVQNIVQAGDSALYEYWLTHAYTVHFEPNGGEGLMSDQAFEFDKPGTLDANAFTRKYYAFDGWTTNETGAAIYGDCAVVTNLTTVSNGVVTLYATWRWNAVEVEFDAQGGTPAPENSLYELGKPYGVLPDVALAGYTFGGWYTGLNGAGDRVTAQTIVRADVTKLYAHWLAHAYTVRFHANGGTGVMSNQAFEFDQLGSLDANTFTRKDHAFDGWATSASGSIVYADGAEVKNLTDVDGGVVELFAVWKVVPQSEPEPQPQPGLEPQPQPESRSVPPQVWTVTFNANGGEGSMAAQMFTNGVAQALNENAFARFGWDFAGWATSTDGEVIYADGQRVKMSSAQTLYAQWEEIKAGTLDTSFAKAQTVDGALYDKRDRLVGTIQVKAGKISKKGIVKFSATATLIVDGKTKKVAAKAVNVELAATSAASPVKVVFKAPIGEMAFEMKADGAFTLKNASYLMAKAKIGGALNGGSRGTFRLDDFHFAVKGELQDELIPYEEPFKVKGNSWTFEKAATVKWAKDKKTKQYGLVVDDSKGKTNLSGLKLTYTLKTGQFKGSFKAYALETTNGKTKLVKYTVNVIGFVVDGVGHGEASCKKPAGGPWSVTVE